METAQHNLLKTLGGCGKAAQALLSAQMNKFPPSKLLFIRLDRIGDLVLTLPVDEGFPEHSVKWWIPHGLSFVAESASPPRSTLEVAKKPGLGVFLKLLTEVRAEKYEAAVIFHAPWWVSLLVWLARIPIRGGVKSQWHSFLFLNRALRQKRSRAEVSELEYNYRLLEAVFQRDTNELKRTSLRLVCPLSSEEKSQLLKTFGLEGQNYSVVHPGMGGSALNWPSENYIELIQSLSTRELVVITGTPADEPYIAPLRTALQNNPRVIWLNGKLKGPELISILASANIITAPSTGVVHLAASTSRPTLGIYSPVRVQHPRRWGPQGQKVATLTPQVTCPGELGCLGPACSEFDCMKKITTAAALKALESLKS